MLSFFCVISNPFLFISFGRDTVVGATIGRPL